MKKADTPHDLQWDALSKNDWQEILTLSKKRAFRSKFEIVEAFTALISEKGLHEVSYADVAKKCGVTRPLVSHHFPTHKHLISLSYQYVYARLQKRAADAIVSRVGFGNQFKAYAWAVSDWITEFRQDARFLVHFFAVADLDSELLHLHQRNVLLGRDRIVSLLRLGIAEGVVKRVSGDALLVIAHSAQIHIGGYIVAKSIDSRDTKIPASQRDELWRCLSAICGVKVAS